MSFAQDVLKRSSRFDGAVGRGETGLAYWELDRNGLIARRDDVISRAVNIRT
jgi:hypothetical protein